MVREEVAGVEILELREVRPTPEALTSATVGGYWPAVDKAWGVVRDSLFLWRPGSPSAAKELKLRSDITAVAVVETFSEAVANAVVVATTSQVWLIEAWDDAHLVATATVDTECTFRAIATLPGTDRIFGGADDGHVYEFIVHSRTGLEALRQLQMVCHTRGWMDSLLKIVHRTHGGVVQLMADSERSILVSLHNTGEIQAFDLGQDNRKRPNRVGSICPVAKVEHSEEAVVLCRIPIATSRERQFVIMGRNGYQIFLSTWKEGLSKGSQRPNCLRVVSMIPPWEGSTIITAAVSGADTAVVEQTGQEVKLWLAMGKHYVSSLNGLQQIGNLLGLGPDKTHSGFVLVGTKGVAHVNRKDTFEALGVDGFARVFGVEEAAAECFRLAALSKHHANEGVIHAAKCALLESLDEAACLAGLRLTKKRLLDPIHGMQLVSSGSRALLQELVSKYSAVLAFVEENLPDRSLNGELQRPLDRLELLLLLGEAGDVSGQHCLGALSCGQALEDDLAFHVVLEVLIAMVDDNMLIAHATPELIGYLQQKSNLDGNDTIPPEASGYAHLLARVHREQGNSVAAATIFRTLGHRAEGVALSLRIQYVAAAVEQFKVGEDSTTLEEARHDLRVAVVQERLVRRLELLQEDSAVQRLSSRLVPAQQLHDFYTQDYQIWDISLHLVAILDANPGVNIIGRLWDLHLAQGWYERREAHLMEKFQAVCCRVAELARHLKQLPCDREWSFPLEHLSNRLEGMAAGELPEPHPPLPPKRCAVMIATALAQGASQGALAKFYFGLVSKQWISPSRERLEETYTAIRAMAMQDMET